jgi:hypothetical protein
MLTFSVLLALSPAGGERPLDIPHWAFYIIYPFGLIVILVLIWLKRRK